VEPPWRPRSCSCRFRRNEGEEFSWTHYARSNDTEHTPIDTPPGARYTRTRHAGGVVRHQHQLRSLPPRPVGCIEAEIERHGSRGEQIRQTPGDRPQLGVPVILRLYDLRVGTQGRVVDEQASVHASKINSTLRTLSERIQGTDDIGAIDTNIERKVVAGPSRNTDERKVVLVRHCRNESLRTVATCDTDCVRTPGDDSLGDSEQIVVALEHDRLDATSAAFAGEIEAFGFAAAGSRVDNQDRMPRPPHWPHQSRPEGSHATIAGRVAEHGRRLHEGCPHVGCRTVRMRAVSICRSVRMW